MSPFLQWLFGINPSPDWNGGDWSVRFQSLPEGARAAATVLLGIVAVAGVWYLYKKEGRTIGQMARLGLAALRVGVLACVAIMLAEIVLIITKTEYAPAHLLLLFDTSESMDFNDPYPDEQSARRAAQTLGLVTADGQPDVAELRRHTRIELALQALSGKLGELRDGRVLVPYRFSTKLEPLEGEPSIAQLRAAGAETAIGDAIENALAANRGQPLAGVLVVTDGQSNAGQDPRQVAAAAAKEGVPIVSLAVGTKEGPTNARIADLENSPVVFVSDPAEVSVLVESKGLNGTTASVTLQRRQGAGDWVDVGREDVVLGQDAVLKRVTFPYTPEATGQIDFRAQVSDVGPELTDADNADTTSVKVVRQRIRVLVIAGYPSPEMQFLRNALLRDAGMEFASWLQSASEGYEQVGHRPLRRLPATLEELEHYDVLVLFDPDVRALGPSWPELLTKFVGDAGGGLIYVAGEMFSSQLFTPSAVGLSEGAGLVDNSWLRALPVVRDPGLYQSEAEVRLSAREMWNLELTPEGDADSIFRFAPEPARNREILASLPGMYWHFPVTRAKHGATVLARHGDPRMRNAFGRHVLMATHLYGPGRTVFLGFDSTYRWRYLHEEYFDGFWARIIDRVGRSKVLGGRYPFALSTDKSTYRVGDRVTVRARLIGATEATAGIGQLRGEVEVAGGLPEALAIEPLPEDPSVLETSFTANEPGAYILRVLPATATELDTGLRPATLAFRVESPRQETDHPTLNRPLLEEVARATGGRVFSLAEADQVASAFKVKQVARILEYRDEMWDAPLLYGGIVLLLTAEWLLRKRYRMA
jgi:cbb3-type cytochrome oxidase subunit 3